MFVDVHKFLKVFNVVKLLWECPVFVFIVLTYFAAYNSLIHSYGCIILHDIYGLPSFMVFSRSERTYVDKYFLSLCSILIGIHCG